MNIRTLVCLSLLVAKLSIAQTIQPMISEYKIHGDGKFAVTNNSLSPMVVLLEPMSFSITPEGRGIFRSLDAGIHVALSSSSLKLAPGQTSYVFYKADADTLPAWFTVYATFSSPRHGDGLDVRLMLPHTVYLLQKTPLALEEVHVSDAHYSAETRKVICTLENVGGSLGRLQELRASGPHSSADGGGFPLLPGSLRQVELPWTSTEPPREMVFRFEHFSIKKPVTADGTP